MKVTTLSSSPGFPFNDVFNWFSKKFTLSEDVECYQLWFCPPRYDTDEKHNLLDPKVYDYGTSFEDLDRIEFKSRVVILNIIDSVVDEDDNIDVDRLQNFSAKHSDINFIVLCPHLGLGRTVQAPNLYIDEIVPTSLTAPFKPCTKGEISNKFLCLNSDTKLHRVMTVSYLLSKDYANNGDFTYDFDREVYKRPHQYKNWKPIPTHLEHLKENLAIGLKKLKDKELNLIDMTPFDWDVIEPSRNHNEILVNAYSNYGVEIITGSMFFERSGLLSEKELQNIYAKNFPIYITGVGMVKELKNLFGLDLFDDIIDHSYDDIEDHFERMVAAIDRNEHLLNGSTNIQELWLENQDRFDSNIEIMNRMLFDVRYQRTFAFKIIKKSLAHFNVQVDVSDNTLKLLGD